MLRTHQSQVRDICKSILAGEQIRRIYLDVTPGGGKSGIPPILANELLPHIADKILWVVPRLTLRDQAEGDFQEDYIRALYPSGARAIASDNVPNPTHGFEGYLTTYQSIVANPLLHKQEFDRHRYILVLDEPHHIEEGAEWHKAFVSLVEHRNCKLLVFMGGTYFRAGRTSRIAFIPYSQDERGRYWTDFESDPEARYVLYPRSIALAEGAIARLDFQQWDISEVAFEDPKDGSVREYDSFDSVPREDMAKALRSAISTEFAPQLLDETVKDFLTHKQVKPWAKLLVVASDIPKAYALVRHLAKQHGLKAEIATSDESQAAKQAIRRFKNELNPNLDVLVTVAMAYEGLDVPQITHIACLTRYRTRQWLEQCFARANRLYKDKKYGYIWVPRDSKANEIIQRILEEQLEFAVDPEGDGPGPGSSSIPVIPITSALGMGQGLDLASGVATPEEEYARWKAVIEKYGIPASPSQLKQASEEFHQGLLPPTQAPSAVVERPSDQLQFLQDEINGHIRAYAWKVQPKDKQARALFIEGANTTLAVRFRKAKHRGEVQMRAALQYARKTWPLEEE